MGNDEDTREALGIYIHHANDKSNFRDELEHMLNRYSLESGSDTPDFILADYLLGCLENFDRTLQRREQWYGRPVEMFPVPTPKEKTVP